MTKRWTDVLYGTTAKNLTELNSDLEIYSYITTHITKHKAFLVY